MRTLFIAVSPLLFFHDLKVIKRRKATILANKKIPYPHLKITEQEPNKKSKQKPTEIVHRHLQRLTGTLNFQTTEGTQLITKFSSPQEYDVSTQTNFLTEKCDTYIILHGIYLSFWKNNPDKGFIFISGNRKSEKIDILDIKKAWIRISAILKHRKKLKKAVLSTT
jgi:hypothetical protein